MLALKNASLLANTMLDRKSASLFSNTILALKKASLLAITMVDRERASLLANTRLALKSASLLAKKMLALKSATLINILDRENAKKRLDLKSATLLAYQYFRQGKRFSIGQENEKCYLIGKSTFRLTQFFDCHFGWKLGGTIRIAPPSPLHPDSVPGIIILNLDISSKRYI